MAKSSVEDIVRSAQEGSAAAASLASRLAEIAATLSAEAAAGSAVTRRGSTLLESGVRSALLDDMGGVFDDLMECQRSAFFVDAAVNLQARTFRHSVDGF